MTNYPTDIHIASDNAPTTTGKVARCQVCGVEWQVRSGSNADAQGCSFCNAPARAIRIRSEKPTYGGATIY